MNASSPRAATAAPLLALRDVQTFYGSIACLRDVSLDVHAGTVVALVGSNGAGKTTLLNTVSGLLQPRTGTVRFDGEEIAGDMPWARVSRGIAHCPEGRQVFGEFSVEDNIRLGGHTRPRAEVNRRLEEMYALFPVLSERRTTPAGLLSGGQQQMLAIARALMSSPRLLLLDEPSMGLAPLIVHEVFRIIQSLKSTGVTILLVEQNACEALPIADHAYVIETGRIVLDGTGAEVLANDQVREAYLGL